MKKNKKKGILPTRLLEDSTPFAVRESFNQLRTNLMYTMTELDSCPIYAITSVTEDSGKSTVITNLALSFTQIGKKVLLIDGDMRCPVVHRFFRLDSRRDGLSELISGIQTDVIYKDIRPNLDLITSGRIPPNPSELLTSPRLKALLDEWKKEYDVIFIDFPPIGVVTDAIAVCQHITGYLFDIRSGQNSAKSVTMAIDSMRQVGAKIVGVVLNDYNIKGSGSHYNSRYSKYSKYSTSKYEQSAIRNAERSDTGEN